MSGQTATIGIICFVAGTVGGGLGYQAFFTDAATLENDAGVSDSRPAEDAPVDLTTENQRLRAQIESLRSELDRKSMASADAPQTDPAAEQRAAAAEAAAKMGVQFDDPKFQAALASIDWNAVGGSMKDMVPLIQKLGEQLANGESPDLALAGEVQKLNGELLKAAQQIMQGKIPGSGINGAFTHPAVVANQFAAALKSAGLDLTDEQRANMDRIMKYYSVKDDSLRRAAHECAIQTLAEEAEFKNAFYKEARALLTPEQRAAITVKGTEGRLGFDIFDSSLMLGEYARPIRVKNAAELASAVAGRMGRGLELDAEGRKQLDTIMTRWANELPAEYWAKKADRLELRGNMAGDRIRAALQRQTALTQAILANVKLSPRARARLLENMRIFVPLPQ